MRSAFTTTYLTILSIIQGVALAVLFAKVDSLIARHLFHAPEILLSIGIFLAIVAVWNQYQMGLMIYVWTAQLFDAFIPFMLGLFEFWMISGIEHGASAVLFSNGLLLLTGLAGLEYQYFQVRSTRRADAFVHQLNRSFRATDAASAVGAALVSFGTAALISRSGPPAWHEVAGASLLVALAIGHLVREVLQWRVVQRRLSESSAT